VGAENLRHQAILVNHASGAVAAPDPELIQIGDAVGQRAQWRGLVEGAVAADESCWTRQWSGTSGT
jgi:hypothetical protein